MDLSAALKIIRHEKENFIAIKRKKTDFNSPCDVISGIFNSQEVHQDDFLNNIRFKQVCDKYSKRHKNLKCTL